MVFPATLLNGLALLCFLFISAQIPHQTPPAFGLPRLAHIPSVQDHPVVGVEGEFGGDVVFNRALDRDDIFAHRHAGAVAEAQDMRVHSLRGMLVPHVQNHVRRLSPHAGQRLHRRARGRDLAAILVDQLLAEFDDVLGFVPVQADRFDMLNQTLLAQRDHLFGRVGDGKKGRRRPVHPLIGRLRGQRHGDNQREGVGMIQLSLRLGAVIAEPREHLVNHWI